MSEDNRNGNTGDPLVSITFSEEGLQYKKLLIQEQINRLGHKSLNADRLMSFWPKTTFYMHVDPECFSKTNHNIHIRIPCKSCGLPPLNRNLIVINYDIPCKEHEEGSCLRKVQEVYSRYTCNCYSTETNNE